MSSADFSTLLGILSLKSLNILKIINVLILILVVPHLPHFGKLFLAPEMIAKKINKMKYNKLHGIDGIPLVSQGI